MEAQNLHVMGAEGPMKTKYTDGFNPTKTRAHSRMSNAPLLVTEHAQTYTRSHTHAHTHTHTRARTHARTHARTRTRTRTRTHTRTRRERGMQSEMKSERGTLMASTLVAMLFIIPALHGGAYPP